MTYDIQKGGNWWKELLPFWTELPWTAQAKPCDRLFIDSELTGHPKAYCEAVVDFASRWEIKAVSMRWGKFVTHSMKSTKSNHSYFILAKYGRWTPWNKTACMSQIIKNAFLGQEDSLNLRNKGYFVSVFFTPRRQVNCSALSRHHAEIIVQRSWQVDISPITLLNLVVCTDCHPNLIWT